jgi:hypothetical protein
LGEVESKKEFESRLDRAIIGLEGEINDKRRSVQRLMDELGIQS